jgi:8-oxo-dGTP pyrophosphatase MutT (NUDIX family)
MNETPFEKTGEDVKYEGKLGTLRVDTYRHEDGEEVSREVFDHPGAVGIVAYDDEVVWLVRQPREATGEVTLELPAGKYDEPDEASLDTAKRELAEEIGKKAEHWEELKSFYTTPGFASERVDLYVATELSDEHAEPDENERIEIVRWPLGDIDAAIAESRDSKTLIGLLLLQKRLADAAA